MLSTLRGNQITPTSRWRAKSRILVLASTADLNCPTEWGLVADKIDPFVTALFGEDYEVVPCLAPFQGTSPPPTYRGYKRSERLLLRSAALAAIKALLRSFSRDKEYPRDHSFRFLVWESFLEGLQPDLIMGIGLDHSLLRAGHASGRPCVEVQHGLLGRGTVSRYWPQSTLRESDRPSLVLAWDEHYVNELRAKCIDGVSAGPGTNYMSHGFLPLVSDGLGSLSSCQPEPQVPSAYSTRKVLVLGYWNHPENPTSIPTQALELLQRAAASSIQLRFVLRIHPVIAASSADVRRVRHLLQEQFPGAELHDPRQVGLFESLRTCHLVLSGPSATVFEAAMLGLRTCIWGSYAEGDIPEELDKYVTKLSDNAEIALEQVLETLSLSAARPYQPENSPVAAIRERLEVLLSP